MSEGAVQGFKKEGNNSNFGKNHLKCMRKQQMKYQAN